MKKVLKNQNGFTLVEIICAIALLGILAVPTYNIFIGASVQQDNSKWQLEANNTAQLIMEDLLSQDTITVGNYDYTYDDFIVNVDVEKSVELADYFDGDPKELSYETGETPPPKKPDDDDFLKGPLEDYNARIEVFDFIDEDYYFISRAASALLFRDDVDFNAMLKEFETTGTYKENSFFKSSLYKEYKPIDQFTEEEAEAYAERANINKHEFDRAYACFASLTQAETIEYFKFMMNRYKTVYDATKSGLAHKKSDVGDEKINYILNSPNIFATIDELYKANLESPVTHKFFTEFPEGTPDDYKTNLQSYMIKNLYNTMYTRVINATTNGPVYRLKLYDVHGNLVFPVVQKNQTAGGGYGDVNFQLMQDYMSFVTWNGARYTWTDSNPLNIKTATIPQAEHWGFPNMYKDMTFYVTGTLDYQDLRFNMYFQCNYSKYEWNPETNKCDIPYKANMNFVQNLSHGGDLLLVRKDGDYDWLTFNETVEPGDPDNPDPGSSGIVKTTFTWGASNDSVYKVTVKLFKNSDTAKKKPLSTLISFKNTSDGTTVTTTVVGGPSPTPTPAPAELPTIDDLPSDSNSNFTVDFQSGNSCLVMPKASGSSSYTTPSVGTMTFNGGIDFSLFYGKNYLLKDNHLFAPTYHSSPDDDRIKELVFVFDGNDHNGSFCINLNGSKVGEDKQTVFVIYNYAGLDIDITSNTGSQWLKYGGVVVVDKAGNINVLK